jgi:hypothetical protein
MASLNKSFTKTIRKFREESDYPTYTGVDAFVIDVAFYLDVRDESEINEEDLTIIYDMFKKEKSSYEVAEEIKKRAKN